MCPSPTNTPILVNRLSIESLFIKRQEFSWNKGSLLVVHILLYGYPRSCVCVDTPGSACIGACATVFRFNPCCTASLDVMLSEVHRDPGAARSASSKRFISPDHLTSSLSLSSSPLHPSPPQWLLQLLSLVSFFALQPRCFSYS